MKMPTFKCLFSEILLIIVTVCFAEIGYSSNDSEDLVSKAKWHLSQPDKTDLLEDARFLFYKRFGDPRLTEILRAVWELDKQKYPNFAWATLNDPEVRIAFGQLWGQWTTKIGSNKDDIEKIRSYVRPFIDDATREVRMAAVSCLGSLGTDSDLQVLSELVHTNDPMTASAAVFAIASSHSNKADVLLLELENKTTDPWLLSRIHEAKKVRRART